ncbi:MAG: hypothetical protein E6G62_09890 [Actinobacteria bacterium]|nr:MAG: hypothetical protein E6G62_09890 [Actinomycetota bacterium]
MAATFAPLVALAIAVLAPVLVPRAGGTRALRMRALQLASRRGLARLREGLRVFGNPRQGALASVVQLGAWALQWISCWLLLMAFGLDAQVGVVGAAAVLFAVNITAVLPATPANAGVFQAACAAVLVGAYHVGTPAAIAFGIVLQVVEIATALAMGLPALVNEGLSWREVRLRTMHAAPVTLGPLPGGAMGPARPRAAARAEG